MHPLLGEIQKIGQGRSAQVYLHSGTGGSAIVHKIFRSAGIARWVQFLLTGAPNPYGWCKPAIAAAAARREVLRVLVQFWFGDRLRLPALYGFGWNPEHRTHELRVEHIRGTHLPLRSTVSHGGDDPLTELVQLIMRPLATRLIESGFDGLVWQAGLGNPVAGGNFMLERNARGSRTWVWIDLESGVPALFPMNPLKLFTFYLPRSLHYGHPLFDDVDIARLQSYIASHRGALEATCGSGAVQEIAHHIRELEIHQSVWKSMARVERGTSYYQSSGELTDADAAWYRAHPWQWQARLAAKLMGRAARECAATVSRAVRWVTRLDFGKLVHTLGRLISSTRFRRYLARRFVRHRIADWQDRRFLTPAAAGRLKSELRARHGNTYLPDFCIHLAIKPLVKSVQWLLLPALVAIGILTAPEFFVAAASGGAVARTIYTSGRCMFAIASGQRPPWIALAIGCIPVFGNAAFPMQLVFDTRRSRRRLPQFLLLDALASLGRSMPLWGGANSLVEAYMNRIPEFAIRRLAWRRRPAASDATWVEDPT